MRYGIWFRLASPRRSILPTHPYSSQPQRPGWRTNPTARRIGLSRAQGLARVWGLVQLQGVLPARVQQMPLFCAFENVDSLLRKSAMRVYIYKFIYYVVLLNILYYCI